MTLIDPLSSCTSASKMVKPRVRVRRRTEVTTRPRTVALNPGTSEAIGKNRLLSS